MFIASNHKITTPHRDVFGNVLDGMPEWMVIIGDKKLVFFHQSNYVRGVEELKAQFTCLTGAFMLENFGLVDPYDFCGEEVTRRALPTPGKLCCLASCTFWDIVPEDKIELETVVFRPCLHYTELLHELVEFYTRKKEKPVKENKPVSIRRFYHPNASYTQPLPKGYVNDTVRYKEEFFSLDWVRKFIANHDDEAGNHFVFNMMEVEATDAYLDFDDLEIKCGCFAVFVASNATERRFIGFAENEFSTDKFFEWFATAEEQNKWKIKRKILRSRLADAANEKLKNLNLDKNNKTPIRKEILERKFEPGESSIVKG